MFIVTFFLIPGAPDIPRLFRTNTEQTTETSITLSWRSGFHGGANQTFFIQYKTSITAWRDRAQIYGGLLENTDFNATIDSLESGSDYSFRIFAANVYGRSNVGTTIDATTKESKGMKPLTLLLQLNDNEVHVCLTVNYYQ